MDATTYEVDSLAFEFKAPDLGYTCKASYLKEPHKASALVEIFKDGEPLRAFTFPAYKIWNIAAHFTDIVDGEIKQSTRGYEMAAWDGISGALFIVPKRDGESSVQDGNDNHLVDQVSPSSDSVSVERDKKDLGEPGGAIAKYQPMTD